MATSTRNPRVFWGASAVVGMLLAAATLASAASDLIFQAAHVTSRPLAASLLDATEGRRALEWGLRASAEPGPANPLDVTDCSRERLVTDVLARLSVWRNHPIAGPMTD